MDFLSGKGILREDLQYVEALLHAPSLGMNQINTIPLCKKAIQIFSEIIENESTNSLSKEIKNICASEIQQFKSMKPEFSKAFQPTLKEQLNEITKYDYETKIQSTIEKYYTICKKVLIELEKEQKKFFDGTNKQELTDWWLETIYEEYRNYVTKNGVDLEAIDSNYIDNKPKDISQIRNNLEALERILSGFQGISSGSEFSNWIRQLMDSIYKRIESFNKMGLYVLALELNLNPDDISMEKIQNFVSNHSVSDDVNNLYKDILYIEEMFAMEEHIQKTTEKSKKGLSLSNVVPISGLIMSSFYRLENELRTIIELYGSSSNSESQSSNLTSISPNTELVTIDALIEQIISAANCKNWDIVISCAETAKNLENSNN